MFGLGRCHKNDRFIISCGQSSTGDLTVCAYGDSFGKLAVDKFVNYGIVIFAYNEAAMIDFRIHGGAHLKSGYIVSVDFEFGSYIESYLVCIVKPVKALYLYGDFEESRLLGRSRKHALSRKRNAFGKSAFDDLVGSIVHVDSLDSYAVTASAAAGSAVVFLVVGSFGRFFYGTALFEL